MADRKRDPIPPLEWTMAALGLVAALILLGIIGREAFVGAADPVPALEVRAERTVRTPGGHVVEFRVSNGSGQTAAAVHVEGKVGDEISGATVDYVPGESSVTGGLVFDRDPREEGLELRVTGYEIP